MYLTLCKYPMYSCSRCLHLAISCKPTSVTPRWQLVMSRILKMPENVLIVHGWNNKILQYLQHAIYTLENVSIDLHLANVISEHFYFQTNSSHCHIKLHCFRYANKLCSSYMCLYKFCALCTICLFAGNIERAICSNF